MTPCAREMRCEERDYQGNANLCPRAFCETDTRYIHRSIDGMPQTYVELHGLLAASGQMEERVSGSREPSMNIAADVEAFMRFIVYVTLSWEERVREVHGLSDYEEYARELHGLTDSEEVRRRDSVALDGACRTLSSFLTTLLSLEGHEYRRPATRKRVDEVIEEWGDEAPGQVLGEFGMPFVTLQPIRYDTSGDAWETVELNGVDAGLEFLALNGRARGMLGKSRQRRRITEARCDECRNKATLVQYEAHDGGWEPKVRCTQCPNAYIGASYDLLMGRVYQVQLEELGKAS
jgi:hypothetical protein